LRAGALLSFDTSTAATFAGEVSVTRTTLDSCARTMIADSAHGERAAHARGDSLGAAERL
jgi:hypothetical protein